MDLVDEVKEMIIESLNLDDSVDALELGLALQKRYGILLDSKSENLKEIFYSAKSLADFIAQNKK